MDKLTMAHEYMLWIIKLDGYRHRNVKSGVSMAWEYADAMQAEMDKRNQAKLNEVRKGLKEGWFVEKEGQHLEDEATIPNTYSSSKDWQPDWSHAPEWANWWAYSGDGTPLWFQTKPEKENIIWKVNQGGSIIKHLFKTAPSFNYTGNWQDSLRERP